MVSNNSLNRPWSTQMEMTFGCDNKCPFCYKQVLHKPKGEYDFMTPDTAYEISSKMKKAGWDGIRLEFAMRGEPFLNPYLYKNINIFRKNLPSSQILVTTNGNHLNPEKVVKFFKAGGNILLVDCYKNDIEKRKKIYKDFTVYDYYDDDFNPYHRHNPKTTHAICLMENIALKNNEMKTRVLLNMGGNVDYKKIKRFGVTPIEAPYEKKCVKPFREIIFMWDGTIPLCCEDADRQYVLGNIFKIDDLSIFWQKNKKLNLCRLLLFNKNRYNAPCKNCDFTGGMRIGFIPKMKILSKDEIKKVQKVMERYL